MSTQVEQMRERIARKGVRAEDIRRPGVLTDDDIAYLPVEKVYQWVREGLWKTKDFNTWLRVMRVIE